jgi:hypothetical protein
MGRNGYKILYLFCPQTTNYDRVYRDVDSNTNPVGYVDFDNFEVFCSLLESLHDLSVKNKEANFLMSISRTSWNGQ